jgi:NADPH-dependent methylglyoxal reductase
MIAPATSKQTILLTGASGFLGAHILQQLLLKGYNVRVVVRSEQSAQKIKREVAAQPALQDVIAKNGNQLSFVIVLDMGRPGAFDEPVKGVSGIIHSASPFDVENVTDNVREILDPAIDMAVGVLKSAVSANEPALSRVVITSSFAAVGNFALGYRPGYTYTTEDWNPVTYTQASQDPNPLTVYVASKGIAEKAAWDLVKSTNPSFSLTTICPPWIFGPSVTAPQSLQHLNHSTKVIYELIDGSKDEVPATDFAGFVDVRDVAAMHISALETPAAAGERFIASSGRWNYQTAVDIIRDEFPNLADKVPNGTPGSGLNEQVYAIDASKSVKVLRSTYRKMKETITDTVRQLLETDMSR